MNLFEPVIRPPAAAPEDSGGSRTPERVDSEEITPVPPVIYDHLMAHWPQWYAWYRGQASDPLIATTEEEGQK